MKQLFRATAVAIGIGIGVFSFAGVAHAWEESASAHSACVGGVATITVTFTNGESPGQDAMIVSAQDDQSDESATWGNGESEITVVGGDTVTGAINTHMATASAGTVRIAERWANGSEDHDVVVVDYEARDCSPPSSPQSLSATTEGAGGCDTTTGGSFVDWSVTNTGDIGLRAVNTDLPGGTPDTLIAPGDTLNMPTLHAAGTFAVASYTVDVEATDGRTSTLHGTLTPTLTGICTPVIPQTTPVPPAGPTVEAKTETAPTAVPVATPTVKAATATLPNTGSSELPLAIAGFGVLGLGLIALGSRNTGAARLRRIGVSLARVRSLR
jgi:LPXTG-motif cell wall-anchored protein